MPKNMANYLTIGRVLMIPVFLVLMYVDFPGSRYWALGVYIVACLTDFADRSLVRQDQDRQHHGVHLPDPVRHSSRAEHRLSSGDPCHHRVLRRGVFREERRRVQVRRDQVTIQIKKRLCTTVQSRFFHAKMSS